MGFLKCNRDYCGGILMILVGLGAALGGLRYKIGTLAGMGPGFFPTAVGVLLALVGVGIALTAAPSGRDDSKRLPSEWRGWACIVGGMVAFVVLGVYGGLVPATFSLVFMSALGDKRNTIRQAFWLAAAMVVIAVVVFWWGLQLQLPLLTWSGS